MRLPGSAVERSVATERRLREIDRSAWASTRSEVHQVDTTGAGEGWTQPIVFKTAFEGRPTLSYGVVLLGGTQPQHASAGVQGWQTHSSQEGYVEFYTGAWVWVGVLGDPSTQLRWTFTFTGMALKNRDYVPPAATDAPAPIPQPPPPPAPEPEPDPAILYRRNHATDLDKLYRFYPPHQTDVWLSGVGTQEHQTDLLPVARLDRSHTADLIAAFSYETTHTSDLYLQGTSEIVHTTDLVAMVEGADLYSDIYQETY